MKKHIASILVFVCTTQFVTPSFAQSSPEAEIQSLSNCMDQFFKKSEMLAQKVTGEAQSYSSSDQLKFLKRFTAQYIDYYVRGKQNEVKIPFFLAAGVFALSFWKASPKAKQAVIDFNEKQKLENILKEHRFDGKKLAEFGGEEEIATKIASLDESIAASTKYMRPWMYALVASTLVGVYFIFKISESKNEFEMARPHTDEIGQANTMHDFFLALSTDDPIISFARTNLLKNCNQSLAVNDEEFLKNHSAIEMKTGKYK